VNISGVKTKSVAVPTISIGFYNACRWFLVSVTCIYYVIDIFKACWRSCKHCCRPSTRIV